MTRNVALVYVRVSRFDEDESARKLSPDVQREKALGLRDLPGLTVETFEDLDISGKSAANRPAYQRLLARLGSDVKYVVAYDLSRLTRDGGDLDDLLRATRDHGVLIVDSMNGAITHPDRPRDKMVARMQGVFNQNYLEELSEKVSDALAMKVERGETVGPPPLGYRRNREVLPNGKIARVWTEPDPDVAPIVQLIFREYASGLYSLKSLARKLNADKVVKPVRTDIKPGRGSRLANTPSRSAIWTADTLKDILNNRRYVGRFRATTAPSMMPSSRDCRKAKGSSTRRPGPTASVGASPVDASGSRTRGAHRRTCSRECYGAPAARRPCRGSAGPRIVRTPSGTTTRATSGARRKPATSRTFCKSGSRQSCSMSCGRSRCPRASQRR